jgi:hypothetical protein
VCIVATRDAPVASRQRQSIARYRSSSKKRRLNPSVVEDTGQALAALIARYDTISDRRRAAGFPEATTAESYRIGQEFIAYMIAEHGASPAG